MFIASLICSDEGCAQEHELIGDDLDAPAAEACECGCTLVLLAVSEWQPARVAHRTRVLLAA
jgi:hypothetical protein